MQTTQAGIQVNPQTDNTDNHGTNLQASAQEQAYERIRELIVTEVFTPGSRLRERDISAMVGFSRTPVREALQRLASEGVVRSERNRGMFVEQVDLSEIMDAFDIGASLESRCARLAAKRKTGQQVTAMGEAVEQMNALAFEPEDFVRTQFIDLDTRFHALVGEAAGNRRLYALTRQAIGFPVLLATFKTYTLGSFSRSARHHAEIFDAIRSGDEEWADVAMRNHILAGRNTLRSAKEADVS